MSLVTSPPRSRVKRAALVLSAGLFATTLAIGGGLAANAAPPSILSAPTATVYGQVTLTVSGFTDSEPLTIKMDSTNLSYESADSTGAFSESVYIPGGTALGAHTISVVGTTSPTQSAPLTIVAQPTVSPATASVTSSAFGTTGVTVTFSGFTAGDRVQVSGGTGQSGTEIGSVVTVDASGVISYTVHSSDFGSGAGLPGQYFVTASTEAHNIYAETAIITVVADPAAPATPVKARASFTG